MVCIVLAFAEIIQIYAIFEFSNYLLWLALKTDIKFYILTSPFFLRVE